MNVKLSESKQPLRYSQQYYKCTSYEDNCIEINGYAVIANIDDAYIEADNAKNLALSDVSHLARIGIKNYSKDLEIQKLIQNIPNKINTANNLQGSLVAKLGMDELLILNTIESNSDLPLLVTNSHFSETIYSGSACFFPRQDSNTCFVLTGKYVPDILAKLCAFDLRDKNFKNLQVSQTIVARISAIIIRNDLSHCCCFYLLIDSAYSSYLWDVLIDAMEEYSGAVIGVESLKLLT